MSLILPVPFSAEQLEAERRADEAENRILNDYLAKMRGLPSSEDLDRVAAEEAIRQRTSEAVCVTPFA